MAGSRKRASGAGWPIILIPYAWLVLFFLLPFLIVLKISLSATAIAQNLRRLAKLVARPPPLVAACAA